MSTGLPQEPETVPGPSVGTMVWGVVVVALAGILGATRFGWFTVDPVTVTVVVLVLVGAVLVAGGAVAALRARRGRDNGDGA